jgi:hypothetical protein
MGNARRLSIAIGFKNVKRTTIPGAARGLCADQVLESPGPYIDGVMKTQDPLE